MCFGTMKRHLHSAGKHICSRSWLSSNGLAVRVCFSVSAENGYPHWGHCTQLGRGQEEAVQTMLEDSGVQPLAELVSCFYPRTKPSPPATSQSEKVLLFAKFTERLRESEQLALSC